jgi:hypothetical protein
MDTTMVLGIKLAKKLFMAILEDDAHLFIE